MGEVTPIKKARRQISPENSEPYIEKSLADARTKLIETGNRSRLIHTPRDSKRSRALAIHGTSSDQLFTSLAQGKKPLRFFASEVLTDLQREPTKQKAPRLVTTKQACWTGLQTSLSAEHLQRRLHSIYRDAKTAEEERGINILFIALGFLRWYEDEKSEVPREAPLVLVPASLVRDTKRSTYDVKLRDDEIGTNQALQERLRADFGIMLPDIPETEDWLPSGYFNAVANVVAVKRRWSVDPNAIELGFFSFSKLLMVRDLEPANWPNNILVSHPLVRGLLCDGFAAEPPIIPEAAKLDEILSPLDLVHVVDADSSQTRVIESVRAGRNLVVQGPPGTGKSQTITNIIAASVHAGQSVLFVAEKMAALNVVHKRLREAGLEDICLELHSHSTSKRLVAERLDRTLRANLSLSAANEEAKQLTLVRDRLNLVANRLHTPIEDTGMTPYKALSIQIAAARLGFAPDRHLVEEAVLWTGESFAKKSQSMGRLADLTENAGALNSHVYFGVRRINLQPADFQREIRHIQTLADKAAALAAYASMLTNYFGCARDFDRGGRQDAERDLSRPLQYAARKRGSGNALAATANALSWQIPSGSLVCPGPRASGTLGQRRGVLARPLR